MVFEIIKKGLRGFPIGDEMISIAKTNISLGKTIGEEFLKNNFVEIFLDRDTNRIGFKTSKDNIRGFKIQKKEGHNFARITSKIACESVSRGLYDAKKEEDMWVIKVSEIAKK